MKFKLKKKKSSVLEGKEETEKNQSEKYDSSIELKNPHLPLSLDTLYHLGLDTSMDLKKMFGDVKFVLMGGSNNRALSMARKIQTELQIDIPVGCDLAPIGKTERYCLYKVGPILTASHGMGIPSFSIFIHEVTKLLFYSGAKDVTYFRIGTCGGLGITPGTVIISKGVVNGLLEPWYSVPILGKEVKRATHLDEQLANEVYSLREDIPAELGVTLCANDFYEGQGRIDGAICEYSETDKKKFLQKAFDSGVRNIEMESLGMAAFCHKLKIPAVVLCTVLLDRLKGDQIRLTKEESETFTNNAVELAIKFISHRIAKDS